MVVEPLPSPYAEWFQASARVELRRMYGRCKCRKRMRAEGNASRVRRWGLPAGLMPLALSLCIGCSKPVADPPASSVPNERGASAAAGDRIESTDVTPSSGGDAKSADRVGAQDSRAAIVALVPPLQNPDPTADGWTTESLSESAAKQLERVAQWLREPEGVREPAWHDLLAADFRCERLQPPELETLFQDEVLVVEQRRTPASEDSNPPGPSPEPYRGPQGWQLAIDELTEPFTAATRRECQFKIYAIEASSSSLSTAIHVELSGRTADGTRQVTSVWNAEWSLPTADQPPRLQSIAVADFRQVHGRTTTSQLFADCTEAVLGDATAYREQLAYGMDHWLDRMQLHAAIIPVSFHGLAVGDVNGDGLDDVYVCQPGGTSVGLPNRLLVQQPDGTVRELAAEAGVDWLTESHSALLIDLDNDADQDLVVATMGGLVIAANDGQGHFVVRATKLFPEGPPIALSAADFDLDGDLDLYAACYSRRANSDLTNRPVPYHDANNGTRNVLLRNDRDWRFIDATRQVGLDQNNQRFSFACAWEDYDNDGDSDLYVANDFGRNNLYRNDRGHFVDVAAAEGVEDISAGMSVTWGDYNNDGWMDLYVSNMWSSAGNRVAYKRQFLRPGIDAATRAAFQRHAHGNSLFANLGGRNHHCFGMSVSTHT